MRTLPLYVLISLLMGTIADRLAAQTLFLDLNTAPPFMLSSNPSQLSHFNGNTLFAAHDAFGQEPWISDGTVSGTHRITDLAAGPGASIPADFTALPNGRIVFSAVDAAGRELWITDGTSAGTARVLDIAPGPGSSTPGPFVSFQNRIYFLADDGQHGRELWETDGTPAGTLLVKDLFVAPASSNSPPSEMRVAGGVLYYGIHIVGLGTQLVKSDGTAAGTTVVKQLNNELSGTVDQMIDFNGVLLFRALDSSLGSELWRSNGMAAGTFIVRDLATGGFGSFPSGLFQVGNAVVFAAYDITVGRELFVTDGTPAGTQLLANINGSLSPFNNGSDPVGLGVVGGRLVFSAYQPTIGRELFVSDGTAAGTHRVADLWPGENGSNPSGGALWNGKLFFAANDGVTGIELFSSDGTKSGTQRVSDVAPGFDDSPIEQITAAGSVVLFTKNDGVHGEELCVSDGTVAGTGLLLDIMPEALNAGSDPSEFTRVGERIFFTARPDSFTSELFATDGSVAGTQVVLSQNTTPSIVGFDALTPFRNGLFFFGSQPTSGLAPYFSDGTTAGTIKLADTANCFVSDVAVLGDLVFFQAVDLQSFEGFLYVSDGTVAGTKQLSGVSPILGNPTFETLGDAVLFIGFTSATGTELFTSDGTDTGTTLLKDIHPGSESSNTFELVRAGSKVYFRADDGVHGFELWVSDGTSGGTQLAFDSLPGNAAIATFGMAPLQDSVVFHAVDPVLGDRLFVSDGTSAGTTPILTLPANEHVSLGPFGNDETLLFATVTDSGTSQLWRTDGTSAGTFPVPATGEPGFLPFFATVGTDRELVVSHSSATTGTELFHTADGTAPLALVADLALGELGSSPSDLIRLGDRVFLSADDGLHGRELHVLPLSAFDSFVAESFGQGCAPASAPTPTISVSGEAIASAPFSIDAQALPAGSPSLVIVGTNPGTLAISAGCSLYVVPPFLSFAINSSSSGEIALPVQPNSTLAGIHAYLQVVTAGVGGAIHATPGLELVIGN